MTTNNITTSTVNINNYTTVNHTNESIDSNPYKVYNQCFQIKQLTEFHKTKQVMMLIKINVKLVAVIQEEYIMKIIRIL